MKTTVGLLLLLLTAYSCAATPRGLIEMSPGECCFKFFTKKIPAKNIVSVTKTHSACLETAFVIHTAAGRKICVSQSASWAQKAYNQEQIRDE